MGYIKWFKDLDKDSIPVAGGKGANLGEMANNNLPVPPGFVVTAQAYQKFIEETLLKDKIMRILDATNVDNNEQLQRAAKKIQEMIIEAPVPLDIIDEIIDNYELLGANEKNAHDLVEADEEYVAIRSSATAEDLPDASFAGQQATFLNVKGKKKVVQAVRACWASLFTARAIYYRIKNNFEHQKVLIAVIVQKMVNSEKSGVMFTINPSTNLENEVVIEAVYGLGETIVGGQVNPDLYLVDKQTREVLKTEVKRQEWGLFREGGKTVKKDVSKENQTKQILNDKQVQELARIGKKLEDHYQKPQDIEWAIEKDNIFIVQTRAVTTFKKEQKQEEMSDEPIGKILLRGQIASRGVASGKVRTVVESSDLSKVEKGDVLVTTMTTPDFVPAMQRAVAIVTDEGGLTSHAAIVSREMGIPCIVGTEHATEVLKDGQKITVYATKGVVLEGEMKVKSEVKQEVRQANDDNVITATDIKVVLDLPEVAERAADTGADGIGLVRLEIMIAQGGVHPSEYILQGRDQEYVELLKEGIRKIAMPFGNKPVWVRCSDIRTDEYRNLEGGEKDPKESNPMMGWHAIRRLLDEEKVLLAEFRAIKELHDEGLRNIGVMLPFIIRVDEVIKAKHLMREVGLEPVRDIDFGVMIETPASCWIIEDLCKEDISFVSFGTNDLTQLTLGVDRNNSRIAKLFDEMHPAVLGEIARVIKVCQKFDVKTSICGQAGSRPKMAEFLVHLGIDSISANVDAVHEIRKIVAREEKKILLDAERDKV